jgi:hypothetical protein
LALPPTCKACDMKHNARLPARKAGFPAAATRGRVGLKPARAMNGRAGVKSVLTEVEMLGGLRAEGIAKEALAAGVAEIESHAHSAFVKQPRAVVVVESFEEFLHLLKMVGLIAAIAATRLTGFSFILNRRENLNLDHMSHVRLRVDWAFANVARVVTHHVLHEVRAEGVAGEFLMNARRTHIPCR